MELTPIITFKFTKKLELSKLGKTFSICKHKPLSDGFQTQVKNVVYFLLFWG